MNFPILGVRPLMNRGANRDERLATVQEPMVV